MAQDKQKPASKGSGSMAQDTQKPGPQGTGSKDRVQGEGDYEAARRYDEKMRDHVQHHDIEREARDAEPTSQGEQRELEEAEEVGKRRAKEEDPLLEHPEGIDAERGGKSTR